MDDSEADPDGAAADGSEADPEGGEGDGAADPDPDSAEGDSEVAIDCTSTLQTVTSTDKSYRYSASAGD